MSNVLEVENLKKHFPIRRGFLRRVVGAVKAVDGVDLTIKRGETLSLVGESGCGKTTLIRSILGLEPRSAGTVTFDGRQIDRRQRGLRALRRRAQMVFQDPTGALNPRHTIYEAVAEGIRIHKIRGNEPELVAGALSRAGLRPPEQFVARYPHEISGGQRQRVLIAGAIALEPQLLLADEPVSSLDASIRGEILALLRSLVDERGLSIIAVTHDLGLAWNIADRIAVMYLGRIVELATAASIVSRPQHPYSQALMASVPIPDPSQRRVPPRIEGSIPSPIGAMVGCAFASRCPHVMDVCRHTTPALRAAGDGQIAACHLHDAASTEAASPKGDHHGNAVQR
jgi:peptide/nickel transport system ATP-binding protein